MRTNAVRVSTTSPIADDPGLRRLVVAVLAATTAIGFLLATVHVDRRGILLAFAGVQAICLLLALRGILLPARIAAPLSGFVIFSFLIFRDSGLHDIAVLGLPVVIVGAGLVIGRWGTLAYGFACVLLFAARGVREAAGHIAGSPYPLNRPIDYAVAAIGIALVAILQWLVIGRLNENIRRAQRSEQEQRAASERLREATAAIRTLLGALPDSVFRLDRTGTCRDFFPAPGFERLVPTTEVVGRHAEEVLDPDLAHRVMEAVCGTLRGGGMQTFTYTLRNPDRNVDFEARVSAVDGESAIAVVRDVTERTRAEADREALIAALAAKNAELEQFTYTVSHDLKAPLITIQSFAGYLERDATEGNAGRLAADVARIRQAGDRMRRLLDDLLELSRIGRIANPPADVSFADIAREAIEAVAGRIEARGVQVHVADGLPVVRGDRTRLVEVVQNLVDNAVKFMGGQERPAIEIGTRPAEAAGRATFFVRDNGIGIEPQLRERVFGLFAKLDPASEGTGIGLALVHRIIAVHGGRIWVESEGRTAGSTFLFTLPLAEGGDTL
jgi:signal transduction histidine kinase